MQALIVETRTHKVAEWAEYNQEVYDFEYDKEKVGEMKTRITVWPALDNDPKSLKELKESLEEDNYGVVEVSLK